MDPASSLDLVSQFFGFFCQCLCPLLFVALGAVAGTITEQMHLRNLEKRERETAHIAATDIRVFLGGTDPGPGAMLVTGEVVLTGDALKNFLAWLIKFVGGEIRVYETLMRRARREALLRMKETARAHGYNALANVRLDTSDIGAMATKGAGVAVAIVASATAYRIQGQRIQGQG